MASGDITLDIAKAYGATSDVERQAQVFEEVSGGYYSVNSDSIRRMVLDASVQASDPRAVLVGRDAYLEAGGKIDRELFDDDETESWVDVALLERLAAEKMEWRSDEIKDQYQHAVKCVQEIQGRNPDIFGHNDSDGGGDGYI